MSVVYAIDDAMAKGPTTTVTYVTAGIERVKHTESFVTKVAGVQKLILAHSTHLRARWHLGGNTRMAYRLRILSLGLCAMMVTCWTEQRQPGADNTTKYGC